MAVPASLTEMTSQAPFVLLEDRLAADGPAVLYRRPVAMVRSERAEDLGQAFSRLEAGLASGLHAAGFLSYELGYGLERSLAARMPDNRSAPLLWMGLFPPPLAVAGDVLDQTFAQLGPPPPLSALHLGHDRSAHVDKVRRVLDLIAAGDIYQANLTFPIRFRYEGDPLALYAALRVRQPVAHGGIAAFGDATVLSVSPEMFLTVDDGHAVSRPMKGTAARGRTRDDDQEVMRRLESDPKQRAENLMIVDLIRNDLCRISRPGSVRVTDLFMVESYPTFHTLTSTVVAQLRPELTLRDKLAALFPCGSIVGAPKIRAAEILSKIESGPRGVYTGAVGAFSPDGGIKLNVAIRTLMLSREGEGVYGVGGGVVADSDPDAEYDEALLKARVLQDLARPYDLLETFRWSGHEGYVRLARHMDRLAASAAQLGFVFDRVAAEAELIRVAASWASPIHDRRVRMTVSRAGAIGLESSIFPDILPGVDPMPLRIGLVAEQLDAADPFLRHKTTQRDGYDRAAAQAQAAGLDEGLMLNKAGELADGVRSSIFVQVAGRLATPPVAAGALPGVLRAILIEGGRAFETVLKPDILASADAIYVGSSLRGLRRCAFVSGCVDGATHGRKAQAK